MADGSLPAEGVDYTGGASISALVAAGKKFACRYGGPGGSWKHITPAEAQALSAAGIAVVANAEGSADGLVGGWSTGVSWASLAEEHFARCGMPAGRPIYFSVDFDVQSGQWAAVASALRGCAEVLGGVHRVGVYGGRRAIEWARRDGVARWFWQTYAWSGGYWVPGNHIEQYRNNVTLAGIQLDLDRGYGTDYGQWKTIGADMTDEQARQLNAVFQAVFYGGGSCGDWRRPDNGLPEGNSLVQKLDYTAREVDAVASKLGGMTTPAPAPVDPAALKAAVLAAVTEALADPQVLATVARAVVDEDHRRSAE